MARAWRTRAVVMMACAHCSSGCRRDDDLIAALNPTVLGGAPQAGSSAVGANAGGGDVNAGGMNGGSTGEAGNGMTPSPCALPVGETAALARYDFEDANGATTLRDAHGLQDARLEGGSFTSVAGPDGCGRAISFEAAGVFAVVPNLPAWDLAEGSVDFWFRVPDVVDKAYGVLGRDHVGTDLPGHLSVWLTADRTVTVRLQGATQLATLCSEQALALGRWAHVGFNFGATGSELWVDHQRAARTGDPRIETVVPECGGTTPDGIAGNEQPWVLGFDTSRSGDRLDGLLQHFDGGALDALQISAVRRDFSKP